MRRNKMICVAVFISLLVFTPDLFAVGKSTLDKTGWYDCIDREECRALSKRLQSVREASLLSSLLAEYLRGEGVPLDMGVVEEASYFIKIYEDQPASALLEVLISLVMKDREEAKGDLRRMLKKSFVPFLALEESRNLLQKGEFQSAGNFLGRLKKRYPNDSRVIFLWAASRIGSGSSPKSIQKKSGGIFENVDGMRVREGALFLTTWARYEMKRGNTARAKTLLTKAVTLDPKNAMTHRLLALAYLSEKKNIPRAVASLKNYLLFSKGTKDAEEIQNLLTTLAGQVE